MSAFVAFVGTVYGRRVNLAGEWFDAVTEAAVVDRVLSGLDQGIGGRIMTPNVDILRAAAAEQPDGPVHGYLADATLVVADGAPLVWASRLAGTPLPERVTGSGLIWSLSAALGQAQRSIYVLGGAPLDPVPDEEDFLAVAAGMGVLPDGARRCADVLAASCPGLRVAGHHAPAFGFHTDPESYARVSADVVRAQPDLVFVGLGFPKQEQVISDLRPQLPRAWFLGCGAAVGFVAGEQRRAPIWMQRTGLEWAHRLAQEPTRLAGRYLAHDAPYALKLLATSLRQRRP